jgi:hypothetical protein
MRSRTLRILTTCLFGAFVFAARADSAALTLRIEAPDPLRAGTTAHAEVFLRTPDETQPLLLTPATEGEAVRVVRGRLLRADAQRSADGELRFELPLVVSSAGSTVLRVDVLTYRCATKCEALRASASHVLHAALP